MTQQQQTMSFPDTIAVCLDEDKSLVSGDFFYIILIFKTNCCFIRFLVNVFL